MRLFSVLLPFSVFSYVAKAQQSQLMQTLSCFNDYTSLLSCTWSEQQDAHDFLKMTLFCMPAESENFTHMNCSSNVVDPQIHWSCHISHPTFASWTDDSFIFKPDRKLEVQLNVSLFNNVQPPPPQQLDVSFTKQGDFLLAWNASDGSNQSYWPGEALDFQVSHKRQWEAWENSSSMLVSNASCLLRQDDLVPGSTYVARVRSKLKQGSGFSGLYSEWSSEIAWKTPEGDEAQPKNLHCLFNGIDRLKCSWEVRQEITSSVLLTLFYKTKPESKEKECSPVHEVELPLIPYVLQSCEISVTNPDSLSQYLVIVRPKEEKKVFPAMFHIKPSPPYNLSMAKAKHNYKLQWQTKKLHEDLNLRKKYNLSFWKTAEPLEVQFKSIEEDIQYFEFTKQSLEPGTQYRAKVRAKVGSNPSYYEGTWSDWSEEYEWITDSVLPVWFPVMMVVTFSIVAMVGMCCGSRYLLKKKREWEAKIPNPPKKFLLPGYLSSLHSPNGSWDFSNLSCLEVEEINYNNVLEGKILVIYPETSGAEKIKSSSITYQNSDLFPQLEAKVKQCLSQAGQSPTVACRYNAKVDANCKAFDFDGPYLCSLPKSSVPEVQQGLEVASLEITETSTFLRYVELPPGLCSQLSPVGNEKGIGPLPSSGQDQEEKQPPPSERQEVFQVQLAISKSEKREHEGQRSQPPTNTNNCCQNWPLDYIHTEDPLLIKERNFSRLLPVAASKEEMVPGVVNTATSSSHLLQATHSELCQKKPETALPAENQGSAALSRTFQDMFGDYVVTPPDLLGSVPKEKLAFSTEEPEQENAFLMFNPDGSSSPVILQQVGDYCFFPSIMPLKGQKRPVGCQLSEMNKAVRKPVCESKCVENQGHYQGQAFPDHISHLPRPKELVS